MNDLRYPINFNFKIPNSGISLYLDLYKSGEINPLIDSVNGGLFFNNSPYKIFSYSNNLPTGNYFAKITYKNYLTGSGLTPSPELKTYVKFEQLTFTGFEESKNLSATIIRSGFTEYPFGIRVSGYFTDSNLPYIGLDYTGFVNGIYSWSGELQRSYGINLSFFNNNKWEKNVNGKLKFELDLRGFPSGSVIIEQNEANFIIIDDDIPTCVKECYS